MIRDRLAMALEGQSKPATGRAIASMADMPYKATIDGLCRLHDAGIVVRFGRKYSATWALRGTPAATPYDPVAALEAVWRAATPHPTGGEGEVAPRPADYL